MDLLEAFRKSEALLDGHFVLRSGLHSRQYFQCALLLQHAGLAAEVCEGLVEKVRGYSFDAVISPAMGGILVGQEMARQLNTRHHFAEKQDGKLVVRRFQLKPGTRYLVAEDVITTGSAVRETLEIVKAAGAIPVAVACIVDRSGDRPPDFGIPMVSLLQLKVETFSADQLPEDLKRIPVTKPGSK